MLAFGQNGENGQSATPPAPVARSSDFANAILSLLLPAMATPLRQLRAQSLLINHLAKTPLVQVNLDTFIGCDNWLSGNTNASTVNFFDNVFTFFNESVTVNCCRSDNTLKLATCGLGASCAGQCSALGASLCPSGECSDDPRTCELDFNNDNAEGQQQRGQSTATLSGSDLKWCISDRCRVRKHPGSHQL